MNKLRIGITMGDINGIGPEIIIRTLNDKRFKANYTPIIYGSSKIVSYYRNIVGANDFHPSYFDNINNLHTGKVYLKNCWEDKAAINVGQATEEGGKYAALALEAAVKDAQMGNLDAIVTAPINKSAMHMSGFKYPGHTEYLSEAFNVRESVMMMVSSAMRIALATNHLPIKDVPSELVKDKIIKKLIILDQSLRKDFGIQKPNIAVFGLNPHAGDNGSIGKEDLELIKPVIIEAKKNGMLVSGPYSADGFFGSGQFNKFDGILAMYHDQGLIPFKALSFGDGVNFTAGLPIVRTSPDHGTAYDLVGTGKAEISSFRNALNLAYDICRSRKEYAEINANPLKKKPKLTEQGSE